LTRQFHLDGQQLTYNEDRKIIKTTIEVPFYKAGNTDVSVIPWKLFTRYPLLADEFKSKIKSMRLNNF